MASRTDTPTDVLALLPLPDPASLPEPLLRGSECVWACDTRLTGATAVDLGERMDIDRGIARWFPRACRTCAGVKAHDALAAHAPYCELCIENAADCSTGRALTWLVQDGRRAEATAP